MRNLKKILALVLALVMSFSFMNVASATKYADITDKDAINDAYELAVELLVDMHVITGYADNTFKPEGTITRAEMAALIYRITTGDVENKRVGLYNEIADFTDTAGHWASSYIGYCATKNYIKGYALGNGKYEFRPDGQITGVEALIMILRAVGYNQTDVFSGKDWKVTALSYGQERGITDDLTSYALVGVATREIVAMMIFNALDAAMVSWTPAGGYTPYVNAFVPTLGTNETLGQKWFDLDGRNIGEKDDWGRPQYEWTYNTGEKKTVHPIEPVVKTTEAIDECDVVYALVGETNKDYAIESSWIDAVEYDGSKETLPVGAATSDGSSKIEALNETSFLGGQGTVLEVYDLGTAGLRIVEINTYLAEVVETREADKDKNNHPIAAEADIVVYVGGAGHHDDTKTYSQTITNTAGYEEGDFLLVNLKKDLTKQLSIIKEIEPKNGGILTDNSVEEIAAGVNFVIEEPGLHTFNYKTDMIESDNFALFYEGKNSKGELQEISWDLLLDEQGNLIGLTPSEIGYLVVEKIEWEGKFGVIGSGYALADVVLANGEKVKDVTIATVNDEDVWGDSAEAGSLYNGLVSDDYRYNDAWSMHIVSYGINADGTYALYTDLDNSDPAEHTDDTDLIYDTTAQSASFKKGDVRINTTENTLVVNNSTVFLYWDAETYTYDVFVGKNNAPSFENATACVLEKDNNFVRTVVLTEYVLTGNTFVAFVGDMDYERHYAKYDEYAVFAIGETSATKVKDLTNAGTSGLTEDVLADAFTANGPGFYELTLNAQGIVTKADSLTKFLGEDGGEVTAPAVNNEELTYYIGYTKGLEGTSLQFYYFDFASDFTWDKEKNGYAVADGVDFNDGTHAGDDVHAKNTKYIKATYAYDADEDAYTATLKAAKASQIEEKIILVAADEDNDAKYVYILEFVGDKVVTPDVAVKWVKSAAYYQDGVFYIDAESDTDITGAEYEIVIKDDKGKTVGYKYNNDALTSATEHEFEMPSTVSTGTTYTITITFELDGYKIPALTETLTIH